MDDYIELESKAFTFENIKECADMLDLKAETKCGVVRVYNCTPMKAYMLGLMLGTNFGIVDAQKRFGWP
jgi:hypothetical protein